MQAETLILGGRYRVDELIGRGGMADVYRGYDEKLERVVAIKVLHRQLAGDNTFRSRFKLEAQAASRMAHQSIVRVFDAGEDIETDAAGAPTRPRPYIIMELVRGTLLKDILARGPLDAETAIRYADGILEALEYSHRAGVIHRDIKPGNVMVTDAGQVKVMDFGIARAVSDSSSTVAQTTRILGTASYFSPEQAKGEPVDARADLYSTGIVLYEMLTGRPPFLGDTPVAVAYQHVSETPAAPSSVNTGSPRALDPVVLRALAKDPFQRFPDAARFREALDASLDADAPSDRELGVLTNELYGPSPRPAQETERTLRQLSHDTGTRTQSGPPVVWIWCAVVLVAVLIGAIMFWVVNLRPTEVAPPDARAVPNLSGMTFERAESDLEQLDLVAERVEMSSNTVAENIVIGTRPDTSVVVTAGDEIEVLVSTGPETTTVPDLVGMSESEARSAIGEAGLRVGSIRPVNDADTEANRVISASSNGDAVDPDAEIPRGAQIDLDIATGQVALVDLTGLSEEEANEALSAARLEAERTVGICNDDDHTGVWTQSPRPGTVPIRSTVTIEFCAEDVGIQGQN